jgi:NADP-dependent 3-hydroxy acid dehydrogenase YdfG/acyl carrier protein
LGKVAGLEHPEIWGGLIDLGVGDKEVSGLVEEIWESDGEDEVALRGKDRYVARLVRKQIRKQVQTRLVQGDGAYLITGGLGALGLRLGQWLVEKGARELILVGRSEPGEAAQAAISRMRATGAEVRIARADVGDLEQMGRLLGEAKGKLRGVVHAAGVGGNESLREITQERWEKVLRAKVKGSWVLHELTKGKEPDFFIGFSSIASVWGSKGQGHYAAGNQFLDMLAHYRRRRGEVGISINWGPWSGGGMATEEAQGWLRRMGVGVIEPEDGLAALEQLMGSGEAQMTAAVVDWRQFKAVYEARGRRPKLERIEGGERKEAAVKQGVRDELEKRPVGERRQQLRTWLQEQAGEVLGFREGQRPEAEQGFFELGMDSLLAVELKNRLESSLGVTLRATIAFDHPTVKKLSEYLATEVLRWEPHTALRVHAAAADAGRSTAFAHVEQLPEDEVGAEIQRKLTRLEALVRRN